MADTHKRKANDWYFKLEAHPLVKRVMADLKPLLLVWGAQLMQQAKEGRLLAGAEKYANPLLIRQHRKQEEAYSDRLNYALDVFSYVSNLLTAVERFGGIRVYLARLPQPRRYEAVGVTEDQWITYHYSNYLMAVVSIYDTCLLLTNAVFALGLDPKECKKATVADNRKVRKSRVTEPLAKLNKTADKYRFPRNLLVHRSELPKLEILDLLEMISSLHRAGKPMMDNRTLDKLYSLARREITDALDGEISLITSTLSEFFDSLQPVYEETTAKLK